MFAGRRKLVHEIFDCFSRQYYCSGAIWSTVWNFRMYKSFSFILMLCKGNSITHYREERFMNHSWMQWMIFVALIKPKIHRLSLFCCHFTIYAFKPSQGMYREKKLTCLWAMKFFMRFQKCAPYLHQVSVMSLGNMYYLRKIHLQYYLQNTNIFFSLLFKLF